MATVLAKCYYRANHPNTQCLKTIITYYSQGYGSDGQFLWSSPGSDDVIWGLSMFLWSDDKLGDGQIQDGFIHTCDDWLTVSHDGRVTVLTKAYFTAVNMRMEGFQKRADKHKASGV